MQAGGCIRRQGLLSVLILVATPTAVAQVITIDNTDAGFVVLSEIWATASVDGQYGADYRYRSTSLTPGEVEWCPTLPHGGVYEVAVWYRGGYDRPSNAHYTIEHATGTADVYVDQRVNGSQWYTIGSYEFAAGTAGRVTLTSAAEAGKSIVADAVRFVAQTPGDAVPEVRACWLTQYTYLGKTEAQLRAMAQNIRAGHMNTVYIAMYTGGTVYWPSQAYKSAGGSWASASTDYAARLLDIFHDEGLKVGAWFEYGFALGGQSHSIAVAHPDWLARDRFGDAVTGENGGFVFISPGSEPGVAMIAGMVRELAENYDFDDIQLDRIRWGRKDTGREYGYEDCTKNRYYVIYGVYPPTNVNNATWVTFREGLVNDAMHQFYDRVQAANAEIVVSSSPLGSYGITQMMQRWSDWVNGGYMDLVMPQMYMTTLSSFITEFNTQKTQAPAHLDKLGVGYRASEDNDWSLVADQIEYAVSQGVPHGCLWVYHQYTAQIAIQDEIDHLPAPGGPWEPPAYNPFVSDRYVQRVIDDHDGSPRYVEVGAWANSAQPDFLRLGSRVAAGGNTKSAEFHAELPKDGRYSVYVWYTAASNRNDAARYTVAHYNGESTVLVDQRANGGQWVPIGRWIFEAGPLARRVTVSTADSDAAEYTSSDGVKLVLSGYALGDADGNGTVAAADFAAVAGCITGPDAGPAATTCEFADWDDDTDVDLADLASFQLRFGLP